MPDTTWRDEALALILEDLMDRHSQHWYEEDDDWDDPLEETDGIIDDRF